MTIALNIFIFIIIIYFQASFFARFDIMGFIPNVILVFMLFLALFRRVYESYIFAFVSGIFLDTISSGPFGLYTATFMIIVFMSSLLVNEDYVKISNLFASIFIGVSALFFYGFLWFFTSFNSGNFTFSGFSFTIGQIFITVGFFVLFFPVLKNFFLWENKIDKLRSK